MRIQVGRPNYNSRDLEAATIILSASILIDEEADEGPPRYYAIASGTNKVVIHDLYMTNLDRVHCIRPYSMVQGSLENGAAANYQSCELDCHEECVGGCNKVNDARSCMSCRYDFVYFTPVRFECMQTCSVNMTNIQYGADVNDFKHSGDIWSNALKTADELAAAPELAVLIVSC